jgi:hypothetical protein
MTVKILSTRVAADTGGGTQDITIAGFGTPKMAIVTCTTAITNGAKTNKALMSIGLTDGVRQGVLGADSKTGLGNTDAKSRMFNSNLVLLDIDTLANGRAAFTSWITDGMRITWSETPSAAQYLTVTFFGGDEFQGYVSTMMDDEGEVTAPGFPVHSSITLNNGGPINGSTDDVRINIGFADNQTPTVDKVISLFETGGAETTDLYGRLDSDHSSERIFQNSLSWASVIENYSATGFDQTINVGSTGNDDILYAAMNFGSRKHWVGSVDSPTSTGDWMLTEVGFKPQFFVLIGSMLQAEDSFVMTGDAGVLSVSVMGDDNQYSNAISIKDGVETTKTRSVSDDKAINIDNHDSVDEFDATFLSFESTGPKLNFSAANGTTRKWIGFAVEAEPTPGEAKGNYFIPIIAG